MKGNDTGSGRGDVLPLLAMVFSIAVLSFVAGAAVFEARWFPYQTLNRAFYSARSLVHSTFDYRSVYDTNLWRRARYESTGVIRHNAARMNPGLTLFTSSHAPTALLMTEDGSIVHEWRIPPERVTGEQEQDHFVYLRKAHIFPNGDLLTFYEKVNATPWGIALIKVDSKGNLLWSYDRPIHHDFDVGLDGKIYALDTSVVTRPFPGLRPDYFPLLDDDIVILSPSGEELDRVSITKAIIDSPFKRMLKMFNPRWKGDLLHTNSIELVTPELEQVFPFLEAGQVVVSIREANMIAAIDMEKAVVSWAIHGYWMRQHDVDLLPNGHFLLFDNLGHFGPAGASRVIEVDPDSMGIVWQYKGDEDDRLDSGIRSAQMRLENGNTLITESDAGRLLEVAPDGEVVWEFRSTWRNGEAEVKTSILSYAERVNINFLEGPFAAHVNNKIAASRRK